MSNSCPAHPIADSLRRRRILYVCHMTPCHRLPSIFASGGLLSLAARRKRDVPEPERPHDWGGKGKREALAGYVVCGFETPKWMCRKHPEELAVILLAEGYPAPPPGCEGRISPCGYADGYSAGFPTGIETRIPSAPVFPT